MLNNLSIGSFYNVKSLIHSMNPTSKIICNLLFIIIVLLSGTYQLLAILGGLTLLIIILGRLPIMLFIKQILSLKYIIAILGLIYYFNSFTLDSFLILIIKIVLIVAYTAILTLTTKPMEITSGITEFFTPVKQLKTFVAKIALFVSLSFRFIPSFLAQRERIMVASSARGIDYHGSINDKIKFIKISFKPIFNSTIKRLQQINDTMKVRLFVYGAKRTNYNAKDWSMSDYIMILIHLSIFAYLTFSRLGVL